MEQPFAIPLILIADDDHAYCEALAVRLRDYGYRVQVAHDGNEAVKLAQAEHPDLFILDVHMPGLDGHDALHELDQSPQFRHTPVIYITGDREEHTYAVATRNGAFEVLHKPVEMQEVVESVELLVGPGRHAA